MWNGCWGLLLLLTVHSSAVPSFVVTSSQLGLNCLPLIRNFVVGLPAPAVMLKSRLSCAWISLSPMSLRYEGSGGHCAGVGRPVATVWVAPFAGAWTTRVTSGGRAPPPPPSPLCRTV